MKARTAGYQEVYCIHWTVVVAFTVSETVYKHNLFFFSSLFLSPASSNVSLFHTPKTSIPQLLTYLDPSRFITCDIRVGTHQSDHNISIFASKKIYTIQTGNKHVATTTILPSRAMVWRQSLGPLYANCSANMATISALSSISTTPGLTSPKIPKTSTGDWWCCSPRWSGTQYNISLPRQTLHNHCAHWRFRHARSGPFPHCQSSKGM